MHDHRGAIAKFDDEIFGAAAKAHDPPPFDAGRKVVRHFAPQARFGDARAFDGTADR
jgi:hypothetical protein